MSRIGGVWFTLLRVVRHEKAPVASTPAEANWFKSEGTLKVEYYELAGGATGGGTGSPSVAYSSVAACARACNAAP
jgi:hypothetical protein